MKTEYTVHEAAEILGLDTTSILKHKAKFTMCAEWWWFNEKREFRCTPAFIEALKQRTTRGKYIRTKK
jgi:hypothetical protein